MGLSEAEFWETTPRQFDAELDRRLALERRWDRRFGVLAVLEMYQVQAHAKKPSKKKWKESDFFPSLKGD